MRYLIAFTVLTSGIVYGNSATDFALFATDDVTLEAYSVIRGDVYAGSDIYLDHSYGIQDSDLLQGDMLAGRNFTSESSCDITGSVFANQDATFDFWCEVTGDVTYGSTLTLDDPGDVLGNTYQVPNSVPNLSLPTPATFTHGTMDVMADGDLNLLPGSYRNVIHNGLFDDVHLYSGDYYLDNLIFETTANIHLHLDGNPLNFYVSNLMDLERLNDVFVNGQPVMLSNASLDASLASDVLFEVHGDASIGSIFDAFFGTVFTPHGSISMNLRDMFGSLIAGNNITGDAFVDHYPSTALANRLPSGDFNGDTQYDCDDINALVQNIANQTGDLSFDMTGDGVVNRDDIDSWLAAAGAANLPSGNPYLVGDANLDGTVDGVDFVFWNLNKFTSSAAWCDGDFDANGVVDGPDFVLWNDHKFMSVDGFGAVPEPLSPLLILSAVCLIRTNSLASPQPAVRASGL